MTTIIGSTAFADEISTLTQQKQDKQNELDQLQQQAALLPILWEKKQG